MYRNRERVVGLVNEEEELENAMFNIAEEPLGKPPTSGICPGGPLNSVLCMAWAGAGAADSRPNSIFSPNSLVSSPPKLNLGDCGLAFADRRRWGGPECKLDKEELENRSTDVLMRLSSYKSVPHQEPNKEMEWDAITSYVTNKPLGKVPEGAAASEEGNRNKNNRDANTDPTSGRVFSRVASTKLSSGIMTLEDDDTEEDLPHRFRFSPEFSAASGRQNSGGSPRRAPASPTRSNCHSVKNEESCVSEGMQLGTGKSPSASPRTIPSPPTARSPSANASMASSRAGSASISSPRKSISGSPKPPEGPFHAKNSNVFALNKPGINRGPGALRENKKMEEKRRFLNIAKKMENEK